MAVTNHTAKARNRRHLTPDEIEHRRQCYVDHEYSANAAAKALGLNRRSFDHFLDRYGQDLKEDGELSRERRPGALGGRVKQSETVVRDLPETGVKRYVLTCAQNNTDVFQAFWRNLLAYCEHREAELLVARYSYNRGAYRGARKPGDDGGDDDDGVRWAPELAPYLGDADEQLAPGLIWCGTLQISPTAARPLEGLNDFTGAASTVVPHVKVAMMPVATPRNVPTKHLYTTGTCTLKNYIQAKAGQKAEFHHAYAALLVEVLPSGAWFARQLVANNRGTFSDFPFRVRHGKVERKAKIAAVQWGDVHVANLDTRVRAMIWGPGGVLDTLRPRVQIFHDLVDGESHNHHTRRDHHEQFRLAKAGRRNIAAEFQAARQFVDVEAYRKWCKSLVIWSNHDEFIRKYLQQTDYRADPENAPFILRLESATYAAIERGDDASPFALALESRTATVLTTDAEPYVIEGITVNFHGHAGKGGGRGSVRQFATLGLKTATGHCHGAWWMNGATSAGTCSWLDMGYNVGPSDWSHTFTLIYEGGKRQQITIDAELGLWRADP